MVVFGGSVKYIVTSNLTPQNEDLSAVSRFKLDMPKRKIAPILSVDKAR